VFVALRRSALFEMGNTRVIAAVYGPREVIPVILLVYLGVHQSHVHCVFEEMPLRGGFHLLVYYMVGRIL
jgi:hypothetical protein